MKRIICIFLLFIILFCCGYRKPHRYVIDASKDAFYHNNVGLNYLNDRVYYAAIEEFKIAITLSDNTQSTATFQNNLGNSYMLIGYPHLAKTCFEDAIRLYGLNFQYYLNLVKCYKQLNAIAQKIEQCKQSSNLSDKILLGLLYIENGQRRQGIILLDEICLSEPNLIITASVKQYLRNLTNEQ